MTIADGATESFDEYYHLEAMKAAGMWSYIGPEFARQPIIKFRPL